MGFRSDINGLRAIAVIAVVLFHFKPSWLSGGFAGVDVFLVISGFLMTGIIIRGLEKGDFSVLKFYIARANRILPALAVLCLTLLVLAWFFLTHWEYKTLGKHAAGSLGFLSNIVYLRESGYFDTTSLEKWLLHTWSLSVEWQFYIIYPLVLLLVRKLFSIRAIKPFVLFVTVAGFVYSAATTYYWPEASYYLLPARVWEMAIGGVAYLYPIKSSEKEKIVLELSGFLLIVSSYFVVSHDTAWPGYAALFPVFGAFLIIMAQRDKSIITGNVFFQKVGFWSYSIYLWHWPLVVIVYYYSLSSIFTYAGIVLSIVMGFLSYRYIESKRLFNYPAGQFSLLKLRLNPVYLIVIGLASLLSLAAYFTDGFVSRASKEYLVVANKAQPSPLRDSCHITKYQNPEDSCEYFSENIEWAVFGDSHTVEIAYALAEALKDKGVGLKHFSFSGCAPAYKRTDNYSKCSKWYNDSVNYILNDNSMKNVVFNHRFITAVVGGSNLSHPLIDKKEITGEVLSRLKSVDDLIYSFAKVKDNVYVFYPIPELQKNINQLLGISDAKGESLENVLGTSYAWYQERNQFIIEHFNKTEYPENVHFIKPDKIFCDSKNCFAVRNGVPFYFDDDHPSIYGGAELVKLMGLE